MLPARALDDLLGRFLDGLPEQVEAIGTARFAPATCSELAHALKGSSRNLGATRLAELLESVEGLSRRSGAEVPETAIDDLRGVVRETREAMRNRAAG
jgi:HPt (histidine-containing phosphotransfer) domain-containing protein